MGKNVVFPVLLVFLLAFCLVIISCDNGTTTGGGIPGGDTPGAETHGSFLAGKLTTSSVSTAKNNIGQDGIDYGDFPVNDFEIQIDFLSGTNTETGITEWGILSYEGDENSPKILITDEMKVGDLGQLRRMGSKNVYCDFVWFDMKVLYEGKQIANFPTSMFIKDEELGFYQNAYFYPGKVLTEKDMRDGWQSYEIIFDKYPNVKSMDWRYVEEDEAALYDDFVVVPFDGIDLNRPFDLKFSWDISILIKALKDAYDATGSYSAVAKPDQPYIKDFFKSFGLEVLYKGNSVLADTYDTIYFKISKEDYNAAMMKAGLGDIGVNDLINLSSFDELLSVFDAFTDGVTDLDEHGGLFILELKSMFQDKGIPSDSVNTMASKLQSNGYALMGMELSPGTYTITCAVVWSLMD